MSISLLLIKAVHSSNDYENSKSFRIRSDCREFSQMSVCFGGRPFCTFVFYVAGISFSVSISFQQRKLLNSINFFTMGFFSLILYSVAPASTLVITTISFFSNSGHNFFNV